MQQQKGLPVKLSSVIPGGARYVPSTNQSSLIVGVRVRPLLKSELVKGGRKDIIRVLDDKVVVVLDPDESKDYLDQVQNRTKEKRYTFDVAFEPAATNEDVYTKTVRDLVSGVLYGINTTVFAYGATGSGKTYTMVGTATDPGLMVLSLQRIFQDRDNYFADEEFEVSCTYLEVYNEVIYDLLVRSSGPLELREDPELGVQVAGLKSIAVKSAQDIMELLEEGNKRRKTEATDANASSSRSHAVLEISIKRSPRNHYRVQQLRAKLALVDLAGSERAAETNNAGQKLRDGANINRSLLALANCINALGKMAAPGAKGGASYVPYRNSKLTRLLKDGLSGNSRTAMIATVAAASDQYHHSINTLKYADRAKEIKTHVVQNVGTVESHIADYQRIIDNLQVEVQDLRLALADRQSSIPTPSAPHHSAEDELLTHINSLVQDMHENIEERINLQKALFEIEDANVFNRYELKQLEEFLEAGQGGAKDVAEARDRKSEIQAAIRDNDKELQRFKAEISANEGTRKEVQARIDRLVPGNQNVAFLNLISTFRLQAVQLQEVKFQMAVRDQIISEQREVIANLWRIIDRSGMGRQRVLEIARTEGIIMDGFLGRLEDPRPSTAVSDRGPSGDGSNVDGVGGFYAAQDPHAATPNATLVGNRAKMRYSFWAKYPGDAATQQDGEWQAVSPGDEDNSQQGSPSKPARGGSARRGMRRSDRDLPAAARRKGAGIRVEHLAHLHPGQGGGGARKVAKQASMGAGAVQKQGQRSSAQAALGRAVNMAIDGKAAGGGGRASGIIPSGRRAGQPAAAGPALGGVLQQRSQSEALDVLHTAGMLDGPLSHRAVTSGEEPLAVQRPPIPLPQPPLNERLAKLKGRLGRRTDMDGAGPDSQGGTSGEGSGGGDAPARVPDLAIQATLAVAGVGLLHHRPTSRSSKPQVPAVGPDALDTRLEQHSRRLSSAGSATQL